MCIIAPCFATLFVRKMVVSLWVRKEHLEECYITLSI